MLRVAAALFSGLLLVSSSAFGQHATGNVEVRFMIVIDGQQSPTDKELTVTVSDNWGNVEQADTTHQGIVDFFLPSGTHRIHIVGSGIEPYYDEFNADDQVGIMHTIQVEPSRLAQKRSSAGTTVASVRLKVPKKARKEMDKARQARKQKRLQEATQHLRQAIAIYPQYDEAYWALGDIELASGDQEGGRRDVQKAVQLNPNNAFACRKLAQLLVAESNYVAAEPLLQSSLRAQPNDPWALSYAALGELSEGKFEQALANARKVQAVPHSGFESADLIAARALELLHRIPEAMAQYQLYLREAPNGHNAGSARAALQRLSTAATSPPASSPRH